MVQNESSYEPYDNFYQTEDFISILGISEDTYLNSLASEYISDEEWN